MTHIIASSLTRIGTFDGYQVQALPREQWAWGDYVLGDIVEPPGNTAQIELPTGRLASVDVGDQVIGAFATRFATLEATGSWEQIGADGRMSAMTAAGLFGVITSQSPFGLDHVQLQYAGHIMQSGQKYTMSGAALRGGADSFNLPVIMIVGSSMSAGKTQSARVIIRRLKQMGLKVAGVKLTGAGRYRDILTMGDAGADVIFDFVDAGLPSTVCDPTLFRRQAEILLGNVQSSGVDVVVMEAGASPLEPYNGDTAFELVRPHLAMMLLCASDPYAVVGIMDAFQHRPDAVAGIACNTEAGMALIRKLAGVPTLRLVARDSYPRLDAMLREKLRLG